MAYTDQGHRFWDIDLTTRAGAESATYLGSLACFIRAGFTVIGFLFLLGANALVGPQTYYIVIATVIELVTVLVAGFRLRAGKGFIWGMAAFLIMSLMLIMSFFSFSIGGIVIYAIFSIVIFNGVRGAYVLKRGTGFEEDELNSVE
jgi:hypothetical protein